MMSTVNRLWKTAGQWRAYGEPADMRKDFDGLKALVDDFVAELSESYSAGSIGGALPWWN